MKIIFIGIMMISTSAYTQMLKSSFEDSTIHQLDSITIQDHFRNKSDKKYSDNYTRIENILENTAGISLISRGNYAQEAIIRGFGNGQMITTINGMHIFGACTDKMDPSTSYVEPSNMQKIAINTNPSFGVGGSNIAGGLQFLLKDAIPNYTKKWSGSLSSQYESNNAGKQLVGQILYSKKKWAILIDGIYRKSENYSPGGNKQINLQKYGTWNSTQVFTINSMGKVNYSQYEKWNFHINTQYLLSQNTKIKIDYIHDDANNIGYPALSMDVKYARANIAGIHLVQNYKNRKLDYWETTFYYNKINHVMDDTKRPIDQLSMHMDMPAWSDTKGAFSQINWNAHSNNQVKIKIESYINRWHAEMTMYPKSGGASMYMLTIPDAKREMIGIDLEDLITMKDKWTMTIGGHMDYNKSYLFSGEGLNQLTSITSNKANVHSLPYNIYVNIDHSFSENISSKLVLSRSMRTPSLRELYAVYLFNPMDNYDYIGNPILKKESSWNFEWQSFYQNPKWNIAFKLYSYWLQNYIAGAITTNNNAMTETAHGVKKFSNISNARISGMEVTGQYRILSNLLFTSNNSYGYGVDKNNQALPLIQSWRSLNKLLLNTKDDTHFYIESLSTIHQNHVSMYYGERSTPGFSILHIGADKNIIFNHRMMNVGIHVQNLFNKYYFEHLDIVQLPRQGRNIQIHISYQL